MIAPKRKYYNLFEHMNQILAEQVKIENQIKIEDDKLIIFFTLPGSERMHKYEIYLEALRTENQILEYIYHLSAKNWFTFKLLRSFIKKVNELNCFSLSIS